MKKLYRVFCVLSLFIWGCNDVTVDCNKKKNATVTQVNQYEQMDREYNQRELHKYFYFKWFLKLYYSSSLKEFSLDDDVSIFLALGYDGPFIYTKSKKNNIAWSERCGVKETLSTKQLEEIIQIEESMRKNLMKDSIPIDRSNPIVFTWKGTQRGEFDVIASLYEPDIFHGRILFDYFVKNIFIHGCKNHPFVSVPALKSIPSTSPSP